MTALSQNQSEGKRGFDIATFIQRFATLGIFAVLVVVAYYWTGGSFLSLNNVLNVLRQVAAGAGIMAVGMLFVILTRGIDLSVGSVMALGCVLTAYFITNLGYSVWLSIILVILCGALCGFAIGFFVAYMHLPSFVMSLAMMAIARSLSFMISEGRPISIGDAGQSLSDFGTGYWLGIPQPVILMFAVFIVGGIVLSFTRFGRIITAIGSNEEAVRLSGIAVPRYVLAVYVISGASLMGGRGDVINTLLGTLVMGIIANIMNLAGVPGYSQQLYTGLIIVVAMLLQYATGTLKR
jgi:ribose/xylose/arabinose/galactoside ABC-type transport system permease subunit